MKRMGLDGIFWVLWLFAWPVSVAFAETETDYMAVLLQGRKIGHAVRTRTIENGRVITTDEVSLTLGRSGQAVSITSKEIHTETQDGKPLGFEMLWNASGAEQKTVGTVSDGKIMLTRQMMGRPQQQTLDWPRGALLSEGLRLLQEKHGLRPGTAYTASLFRPDLLTAGSGGFAKMTASRST